jgi:hypothetical protein
MDKDGCAIQRITSPRELNSLAANAKQVRTGVDRYGAVHLLLLASWTDA